MAAVRFFFALFFAVTAAHVDPVKPLTFPVSPLQVDLMTTQDVAAMYDVLTKSDAKSLLKKCLTQDVFDQLKDKKTSKGATLADVIRSGVVNLDSGVGVYAPDAESYEVFAPLFDKVIEEYHGFKKDASHPDWVADVDFGKFPDLDPENKFIRSTRIRVARNLDGFGLGSINEEERLAIEKTVADTLKALEGELGGTYYPLDGMEEKTREQLVADHFLFKKGDRFLEAAGITSFWPKGRGIFHNADKTFLVWINEEDELRIISMQKGGDVGAVFKRLVDAVNALQAKMKFLQTGHLGFLSSCPTNLGTGLRASVHIAIPHVSKLDNFKELCKGYSIQPRGIHGEHSESEGGVYDLSNLHRLGLSEFQAVTQMYDGIKKIIELEKELAAKSG